ncbi:MAG: Wzz/FepE/Etk N-terminal domain-containing protein [Clostridia bacterium]|nr:Wzz/FepE/Etk N-terminal domain-containing protein [Clostridia bacterium]
MDENKANLSPAAIKQAAAESGGTETQLSIIDIINMMLTFWWLIAVLAILVGGGTYAYSKITSIPQYKSSGTLYIDTQKESKTDDVNTAGLQSAITLLPTYIEVLKSTPFLEEVSDDIDNKYSASSILKMTTYTAIEETNLITIDVKTADPHDAYLITKSIIRNAPSRISRVFEGGSVKVIEYPKEATSAISDSAFKRGIIGFIAGAALAMLIIFLINLFDTRVKSSEELTNRYGLPILGEIPNLIDV